jgi:hypothetical protein
MFLCDINDANFSTLKNYVTDELRNPNSVNAVNTPGFSPINSVKKGINKTATLASIGTAKYIKDKKLNRRQRRQVNKWQQLVSPQPAKKPFFFNPFRKKDNVTTTTVK